jgi:hypothetical protein
LAEERARLAAEFDRLAEEWRAASQPSVT